MNLIITFYVVFFVMCFGADSVVSTDETQRDSLDFTASMCPSPHARLIQKMKPLGENCNQKAISEEARLKYRNASTIEDHRDLFATFCQGQTSIRNCLAETTTNIEVCQNEAFSKTFKIYRAFYETVLETGCRDNGEPLATLVNGILDMIKSDDRYSSVKLCSNRLDLMLSDLDEFEIDISSKFFHLHKEFKVFAECIDQADNEADSFEDVLKLFLEKITNTMKCIHPRDGTLVPCGTIDASSIATPNVCDLYLDHLGVNHTSLYDFLEENTGYCLMMFLQFHDLDMTTVDSDSIGSIIGDTCNTGLNVRRCYLKSSTVSELCLNETERHQLDLFGESVRSACRVACSEGDERLATILTQVFRLRKSGKGDAIADCIKMVVSASNVKDAHMSLSKNMRFYHEVGAFKECFVSKLQGDQPSVDAAASLINDMMKKLKCVDHVEGTDVLCETIHTA